MLALVDTSYARKTRGVSSGAPPAHIYFLTTQSTLFLSNRITGKTCTMVLPEEIQIAARECNITAVCAWLESGGDPNDTDSRGRTPLNILVHGGFISESDDHLDVARLLLSHGSDVNCADVSGFNPLHCCTVFPEDSGRGSLIQLFLDAGVNVNAMTRDQETPLGMIAV